MSQSNQPEMFNPSKSEELSKSKDLWIAGAVVLGVVFLPALVAALISLAGH